ncbi:MAG: TIGR03936 family radical SAM-associated protein [Anaerolineaceae bacterium]|nr:TIGR03936 family radical SAM-associated protein [Anaerolineaceae bacterium]MCY3936288.1 TIGR03936 family radical SAM-associated protein [Chloroflexota bacterium]
MNSEAVQRLRITFGKQGTLKYTGNLDTAKIWERVLRRAQVPVLYTKGFTPRPRLQFATATPLGITSECELLDVWLRETVSPGALSERLTPLSPTDLSIGTACEVPVASPSLPTLVRAASYRIHFPDGLAPGQLAERVESLLRAETLPLRQEKMKRGKRQVAEKEARPLIRQLLTEDDRTLQATLATGERGNLRPRDLILLLGLAEEFTEIHRTKLWLTEGISES